MIKLWVNETKWCSLQARTRAVILYISIWIFDFGPVKLPGRSRNGAQSSYFYFCFAQIDGSSQYLNFEKFCAKMQYVHGVVQESLIKTVVKHVYAQQQISSPRVVSEQKSCHLHSCAVIPFGNMFINNFATLKFQNERALEVNVVSQVSRCDTLKSFGFFLQTFPASLKICFNGKLRHHPKNLR